MSVLIVSLIHSSPAAAGSFSVMPAGGQSRGSAAGIDAHELAEILLGRLAGGDEGGFGLGVKRLAALEDGDQVLHGAGAVGHRPHVALLHDPAHMVFRLRAHPDGEARRQQKFHACPGSVTIEPLVAMTKCAVLAQHVLQRLALGAPEGLLAEHVEDLAQGRAAAPLDLAVELDEGHVELLRQQTAEGGLAAAAQADERDAPAAQVLRAARRNARVSRSRASLKACAGSRSRNCVSSTRSSAGSAPSLHQLRDRQADGARDPAQQHDRAIAFADLELGEIALRHFRVLGQHLARHAALIAQRAHALAEAAQIGVAVADGRRLGAGGFMASRLTCIIMQSKG